jgi:hypothetical protein
MESLRVSVYTQFRGRFRAAAPASSAPPPAPSAFRFFFSAFFRSLV